MKLNEAEELKLKKKIGRLSKYRETYKEHYDHVYTALETMPDEMSFDDAVNKIINEDLGGKKGMILSDEIYFKAAKKSIIKNYLTALKQVILSPRIVIVLIITIIAYLLISKYGFKEVSVEIPVCSVTIIALFLGKRKFEKSEYSPEGFKGTFENMYSPYQEGFSSSIKYSYIPPLMFFPLLLFEFVQIFISLMQHYTPLKYVSPYYIVLYTTVFICMMNTLNALTVYRLFISDFKISFSK